MAQLSTTDKQILERVFRMERGSVLDFSNSTMGRFFGNDLDIGIYAKEYSYKGTSKANRMRCFWEVADDALVGQLILKLIEYIDTQIMLDELKEEDFPAPLIEKCRHIASRLLGQKAEDAMHAENEFLRQKFDEVKIKDLKLNAAITEILEQRMKEIQKCLEAKCPLAAIILCGSALEGILFGVASCNPQTFNSAKAAPKGENNRTKKLSEWTLNNFIDCAGEIGCIGKDVHKFSHALKGFRNYIHPYRQMRQEFNPDDRTAEICWQVLQQAIHQIAKYQRDHNAQT